VVTDFVRSVSGDGNFNDLPTDDREVQSVQPSFYVLLLTARIYVLRQRRNDTLALRGDVHLSTGDS
jgi:hypothetical protein